jgi:branched-chain amino acid transport system permease protein
VDEQIPRIVVSIVGGGALGCTYALVALGMVLVFRATGTFNFAHGQFMLLPAFVVGAWQASLVAPLGVSVVVGLALASLLGIAFYLLVLQRTTGLPRFMGVIATFGLAAILDGAMLTVFGSAQFSIRFPGLPTGAITILGARVSATSVALTLFSLVLVCAIAAAMRFTRVGLHIRAAGQDPILASQSGINVRALHMASWGLAAALAGIAGIAYGSTNIVGPSMVDLALAAFPAILIGGLDSINGAIVGGLLVGIFQGFVATYISSELLDVSTYTLLLGVMLFFPRGLFGQRRVRSV